MSRTGARDKARKQLADTLALLGEAISLISKSQVVLKRSRSAEATECLTRIDSFYARQLPLHLTISPPNLTAESLEFSIGPKNVSIPKGSDTKELRFAIHGFVKQAGNA
ncbi:hypothetical protein [Pseudomonas viridiflava]|uniref:hypothetical protein n=1 Tax=Pseudomonas viridiflava TaxID=33069 RepID=UPI0013CEA5DD|nr:hypothetical protein [Pseudomonas viridiflava]